MEKAPVEAIADASDVDAAAEELAPAQNQDFELVERINALSSLHSNLCILRGSIYTAGTEIPVRVLVDSGAEREYLALEIADLLDRSSYSTSHANYVLLPNNERMKIYGSATIDLGLGTYRTTLDTQVINLPDFDVILGLRWLRETNPRIDWKHLRIDLDGEGQTHSIVPDAPYPTVSLNYIPEEADKFISYHGCKKPLLRPGKDPPVAHLMVVREISTQEQLGEPEPDLMKSLSPHLNRNLRKVLRKYAKTFRNDLPDKPPPPRQPDHTIETGDAKPVNLNAYPLSPTQLDEQAKQVNDLLRKGLIRESTSPWGFPVLFVKKPDGLWRMCIDYRALNAVTVRNGYSLPRIQECLDRLGRAKYMTKLDLTSGYWQVRVADKDIEKTAFNTRQGKFEFIAMPFGLTNAPATFQAMMNKILRSFLDKFVIVYLDDIVIYSNSLDEHVTHVEQVLEALAQHYLYAKPSKCVFAAEEIEFCGHIVGSGKVKPTHDKLAAILSWPIPRTVHEVRQFLGLASYYRKFVRGFARIATPLFDLLKEGDAELRKRKHRLIAWTAQCTVAFETLKEKLTTAPVLTQPDILKPFAIETDASEWAIGCSLLQVGEDGKWHPVAYDGRKLSGAELNYPVHEKELLAIKHALRT